MKRLTLAALALATAGCAFADPAGDPWTVADAPEIEPEVTVSDDADQPMAKRWPSSMRTGTS